MKKILLLSALCSISFFACKKKSEDVPIPVSPIVYAEENPLPSFLTATGFDQTTTPITGVPPIEMGFSFKPAVKGKINSILVKTPTTQTAIRVTLWDKATQAKLFTETIDATANVDAMKNITAFDLVKDKEYVISCNMNGWYNRQRTNTQNANYPVTVGNVIVTTTNLLQGPSQTFPPNSILNSAYTGDISFKFQRVD
jgi:Domain of unknown function (DUF4082)